MPNKSWLNINLDLFHEWSLPDLCENDWWRISSYISATKGATRILLVSKRPNFWGLFRFSRKEVIFGFGTFFGFLALSLQRKELPDIRWCQNDQIFKDFFDFPRFFFWISGFLDFWKKYDFFGICWQNFLDLSKTFFLFVDEFFWSCWRNILIYLHFFGICWQIFLDLSKTFFLFVMDFFFGFVDNFFWICWQYFLDLSTICSWICWQK